MIDFQVTKYFLTLENKVDFRELYGHLYTLWDKKKNEESNS